MRDKSGGLLLVFAALVLVVMTGGLLLLMSRPQPIELVVHPPIPTATATQPTEVVVYITGAVANPGLFTVPYASRVQDAVTQAGGLLPDADSERVNLAATLRDGDHVHVLRLGEAGSGGIIMSSDGEGGIIDLNQADAEQLEALPGVGPVIAARIVAYREANGDFTSVEQLVAVEGIGETTLAEVAPLLRIAP